MTDLIKLSEVMYDIRAKDGTWCQLPYPDHPDGCPNFIKGCTKCGDWKNFAHLIGECKNSIGTNWIGFQWYAVIQEFDLKAHAEKMKRKHPSWSDKQCRCVLYWQGAVKAKLKVKAQKYLRELAVKDGTFHFDWACHLIEIPEAHGVNVFGTMAKAGLILYKNPDLVRKIMFVGIQQLTPMEQPEITEDTPDCTAMYNQKKKCTYAFCPSCGPLQYYNRLVQTCEKRNPKS